MEVTVLMQMVGRKEEEKRMEGRTKETKKMKTCSGLFFQGLLTDITSTYSLVALALVMHSPCYL